MLTAGEVLALSPVLPVVTIDDARDAAPLARALHAGGLRAIEITLRTDAGLDAIRIIRAEAPDLVVGAGTVLTAALLDRAIAAGAAFALSPGYTEDLLAAAMAARVIFIPGVATASEIMRGLELGLTHFKFFPAEQIGGAAALKSLGAPLPDARFCPTGGITAASAPEYLRLANVVCVGGSWIAPPDLIRTQRWAEIEANAAAAARLAG